METKTVWNGPSSAPITRATAGGVGHVQPVVASRERGDIATPRAHFIRHGTADAARGPYDKCIHHVRRSYRAAAIGQSP